MISGGSLAVVTAKEREPIMPSNYTIVQYFSSFIEDPLFDNVGDSKYSEAVKCYKSKVIIKWSLSQEQYVIGQLQHINLALL